MKIIYMKYMWMFLVSMLLACSANAQLVINEFLPYPSSTSVTEDNEVDANGDGSLGGTSDEFIELVNSGASDLDISGWKLNDGSDRHVFTDNTIVPAGGAIVVFAGAPTGTFGNSVVQTASSGGLGLSNGGDTFMVNDESDNTVLTVTYEAATVGVAMGRNPDITGDFGAHPENATVTNDGGGSATISPGTKLDGSFFIEVTSTEVHFAASAVSTNEGDGTIDLTIAITAEDENTATTLEVALTSGTASDISDYTTQTVTFEAGSSDIQTVTITVVDDSEVEGDEEFIFTLQNVSGGNSAVSGSNATATLTVVDNDFASTDLVINEFLPYPSSTSVTEDNEVDANGDGSLGGTSDEFIELVNSGASDLDISGWKLNDGSDRHVFTDNTIVPAGGAIVVFAGAPTGTFGNSVVQTASSGGLGLSNGGDTFTVNDESDNTRLTVTYGEATIGEAMARDPDITGDFGAHPENATVLNEGGGSATISPGTKLDGSFFIEVTSTEVQFTSSAVSTNEGDGSIDLTIAITAEDANTATTVEVALTSGTAADISDYTTQTVTFAAGSSDIQTVTITVFDDSEVEGDEEFIFTLQNVSGGNSAVLGSNAKVTLTVEDNDFAGTALVINEFMPYPSSTSVEEANEVDANGDGSLGGTSDEYIELVNSGASDLDISGWKLSDGSERHVFSDNTIVPAGGAIVVFAGAPTGTFGNSLVQTASSGGLGLSNGGDTFTVNDESDNTRLTITYEAATIGVALARNPDITGDFGVHPENPTVLNDGGNPATISPGTKLDGSFFIELTTTLVQFSSPTIDLNEADGTFEIAVSIALADANNATSADIVLVSGDAADFENYTTGSVTFPAGSSEDQIVTVNITDDMDIEGSEISSFELQNVSGGNSAAIGSNKTFIVTMDDNDFPPSNLILNEFLPYPSSTSIVEPSEVDANGDGINSGTQDEMMEFVNIGSDDLDISGWKIRANDADRHFFPAGTIIAPNAALVLFGGGTPTGGFGGATVQVASEALSGLGILNSGTTISIIDVDGVEVFSHAYTITEVGVSYSRIPDLEGDFALHPTLNGNKISPGTKVDGTPFFVDISTKVFFASSLGGVEESDTTFDFEVAIENESNDVATTADVILTNLNENGDLSYTTQSVVFPAGSSENQTVTITVNDDTELEGDELFTFSLSNISGGDKAKTGNPFQFNFIVLDDDTPLIFNEIHADPASGDAGDANNDGIRDASDDEFIEIVNKSDEVIDMSGYKYHDDFSLRHIFPENTILQPGHALVVFGGGVPKGILGAEVQVASEGEGLGLTNTGDQISLFDANDFIQGSTIYGSDADQDQSITRSPDITGGYALHSGVAEAEGALYSPGRKVSKGLFINIVTDVNRALVVEQISVFPNPVKKYLNIKLAADLDGVQFKLFTLKGELVEVYDLKEAVNTITVDQLRNGLYLYQIDQKGLKAETGRLIINN